MNTIKQIAEKLPFSNAHQVALWLLEKITNKTSTQLLTEKKIELNQKQKTQLDDYLTKIINQDYPIQYILETVQFGPLHLTIKPPILIPRPETELMTDMVITMIKKSTKKNLTILDVCSGSGCIGLWIAHEFKNCTVHGVDIDPQAIDLANQNKTQLQLTNITFFESDLFANLQTKNMYDIIISNPPYITYQEYEQLEQQVKKWETEKALTAKNNGLFFYQQIIQQAPDYLKKEKTDHPQLVLEIGSKQADAVTQILKDNKWKHYETIKDLAQKDRIITATYW